jgi:excisionase family DNA binding protein
MTSSLPDDVKHLSWAAEQLGIGVSTAYRLAPVGQIPGAFKVGAQWRVSVARFEAEVHGKAPS